MDIKTISIIRRRIKDAFEYADFRKNWLPEVVDQYNVPTYVVNALKVGDPKEIVSIALIDADLAEILKEAQRTKQLDSNRKDKVIEVADSQGFAEVFIVQDYDKLYDLSPNCQIRPFKKEDISCIADAFTDWPKPESTFEAYYQEQLESVRSVWVAHVHDQFAGYITLKWKSQYEPFLTLNIPEIMDLNVLPAFRNKAVGSKLLERAEKEAAAQHNVVGLGVGLYNDYGSAQRLYVKNGYKPDGKGITYNYKHITPGSSYTIDDNLVLWFTKNLHK